jgi:hypothetical protein
MHCIPLQGCFWWTSKSFILLLKSTVRYIGEQRPQAIGITDEQFVLTHALRTYLLVLNVNDGESIFTNLFLLISVTVSL